MDSRNNSLDRILDELLGPCSSLDDFGPEQAALPEQGAVPEPAVYEQAEVPEQEAITPEDQEPSTSGYIIEVPATVMQIKNKLLHVGDDGLIDNSDLQSIINNIMFFDDTELELIPNIFCRGSTFYPKQLAREVMSSLKIMCRLTGTSIRTILPAFLTEQSIQCYCHNAGSGGMCTRKRRFGEFTCSRHVKCKQTSMEYVMGMFQLPM